MEVGSDNNCEHNSISFNINEKVSALISLQLKFIIFKIYGPYCGYGSRYQYSADSDVDTFEVLDNQTEGNLPIQFFNWQRLQVSQNDSIQIYFKAKNTESTRYGWRLDWKIEE